MNQGETNGLTLCFPRPVLRDASSNASEHARFQIDMINYMPPAHRALIFDYADRMQTAGAVDTVCRRKVLKKHLDAARVALADLRKFHMAIASSYLRRTAIGTGASDFRSMLKDGIDRTQANVAEGTDAAAQRAAAAKKAN